MHFIHILVGFIVIAFNLHAEAQEIGSPINFSKTVKPGETFMGIQLLGSLKLATNRVNGLNARELSGLAWDEDDQILYAVSDDGYLVHLSPVFTNDFLTGVKLINTFPLRDAKNNILEGEASDAESLAIINSNNGIQGDSILVISLEFPPRIEKYKPDGTFILKISIPEHLSKLSNYSDQDSTLDALAYHPKYGFVTAPQKPLIHSEAGVYSIYSTEGKEWYFTPLNSNDSVILGLEALPDGDLLVLERVYSSLFKPVIYALRSLQLNHPDEDTLNVEEIAHFNSREGWLIDNFESVTKHKDNKYFMVSDDNENTFQKTLLIYFKIINRNEIRN